MNKKNEKNDNPVTPLDLDEIYKEFCELSDIDNRLPYEKQKGIYFDYDSGSSVENFVNFIKSKQSAIETDKVEPKKHYLIQYSYDDSEDECHFEVKEVKVGYFTDKELENFCSGKDNLKVTYLGL